MSVLSVILKYSIDVCYKEVVMIKDGSLPVLCANFH